MADWHAYLYYYKMASSSNLKRERATLVMRLEAMLEGPLVFLGFVWMVLLVIELIYGLTPALNVISICIWVIFVIDFTVKLILAPEKIAYLKRSWLVLISLVIPAIRVLRVFRLFRLTRGLRGIRLVKMVASLNRSMKGLSATMHRRGMKYAILLTLFVVFSGAAGMYAFEKEAGLESYGEALWWTAMIITSIASEFWPVSGEGKVLCLLLSIYGFCVFGYITATLASFFVGRDAEEKQAPLAGADDIRELRQEIARLREAVNQFTSRQAR